MAAFRHVLHARRASGHLSTRTLHFTDLAAPMPRRFRTAYLLLGLGLLAGCRDAERVPTQPEPRPPLTGSGDPTLVAAFSCTATPAAGTVACERARSKARTGDVLIDGQHAYARLDVGNVRYDPRAERLTLDVALTSLVPQPLGTRDGATAAPEGVRVVFGSGPRVTQGRGTVTVRATGTVPFLDAARPYYQWSQVLAPGAASAPLGWELGVPAGVKAFAFTAYVLAPVPRPAGWLDVAPASAALAPGAVELLQVAARNAVGAPVDAGALAWTSSDAGKAEVAGGIVRAIAPGRVTLTASGEGRTGSATVDVCHVLSVGEALTVAGADAGDFCVAGDDRGYVMVATNTAGAGTLDVSVAGTGLAEPPAGSRAPARLRAPGFMDAARTAEDGGFEWRLRERERRELGPLLAASHYAPGPRPLRSVAVAAPLVGSMVMLNGNLQTNCASPVKRTGAVKAVGEHVVIVADAENAAGGFTDADYRSLAAQFDTLVWPTDLSVFGAPSDIDGNGRVILFYTSAVNALTPAGSGQVTLGLFMGRDLFPMTATDGLAACAASNAAEVLYLMAPDPAGTVNHNPRATDWVMRYTVAVQAHELQHVINAANRLYVNHAPAFEETWLNEGLSHVAEELLFMRAAGLTRLDNLSGPVLVDAPPRVKSAFNRHEAQNYFRFAAFLKVAESNGPTQASADLATRGAAWSFLRWAADRKGGDPNALWHTLTTSSATGRANLGAALGVGDLAPWLADWGVSVFADDHVAGIAPRYDAPSWNARSIIPYVDDNPWPLPQHGLTDAGVQVTLGASGNAYLTATSGQPVTRLTVRSGGAPPPPGLYVQVMRTR
jgi:hypothetical protein